MNARQRRKARRKMWREFTAATSNLRTWADTTSTPLEDMRRVIREMKRRRGYRASRPIYSSDRRTIVGWT